MYPNCNTNPCNRRKFIYNLSCNAGLAALAINGIASIWGCGNSEHKREEKAGNEKGQNKLGIALVGLGGYSSGELAPSLKETEHCYLAGIVTGSPEKAEKWKKQYDIPDKNIYNYQNFDTIKDNADIDIVYVVLPNSMHAEYTIRAAKAGKHVICEKPMAITPEDCERMIAACKEAGKMLSIGYRLHFDPYHIEMMRLGQKKVYGPIKKIKADNGMDGTSGWRLDKKLAGGGPLMDLGVYNIQGARYTTGLEPIAVTAHEGPKTNKALFKDIEETIFWEMEFPQGITAECMCSYSKGTNLLRAEAEKGWFELSPTYAYRGLKGKTSKGEMNFKGVNQQARQMDDFAMAVKDKRPTPVPGEMGLQDVKIIHAIYKAMETGERVDV
jgi:predicted dehydrogenase